MAIDAFVEKVTRVKKAPDAEGNLPPVDALELELCPRGGFTPEGEYEESLAGQPRLYLIEPAAPVPVGSQVWGGASSVEVIAPDGVRRTYQRVGYTRLTELRKG